MIVCLSNDNQTNFEKKLSMVIMVEISILLVQVCASFFYFRYQAKSKMNFEYQDHSQKLWITLLAVINFGLCLLLDTTSDYLTDGKQKAVSSVMYSLESLAIFFWVVSRQPHDCFHCYNRIRQIKYSQYAGTVQIGRP